MESKLINKMTCWIPWTRSGKRASQEDDEHNFLLSLINPDVTDILLDYLDTKSLQALRVVCRRTKSWVDVPKYLSKLQIILHSSVGCKKMRKVLRSKTDFSNFVIAYEKRVNEDLILELVHRFPTLKTLELKVMLSPSTTINVLNQCSTLESLSLAGINLSKFSPSIMEELNQERNALSSLRYLSISCLLYVDREEMEYFKTILKHCTRLQSIKLPFINFPAISEKATRISILTKDLIKPLTDLIKLRARTKPCEPNLRYLLLEDVNPLTPELFMLLAGVCFQHGVFLCHVRELNLRSLDPKMTENQKVQEYFETLDGLNENVRLGRLINLKCITVRLSSGLRLTDVNYENATLPKLESLNLYVDTVQNGCKVKQLLGNFLSQERPNVKSLKISYISLGGNVQADLVRAIDITKNFQYLKKLDLYQWDAFDEEFLTLWRGIGSCRIQDLSLLLCTNLTDRGILGSGTGEPAIMKLTGLKDLHISSLYGSITDTSIHRAFRHMKLRGIRLYSQSITYDGIASLLDGVFYTTVESINFSKPLDCSSKEFYDLVKDIVDAKKVVDFHKKRHLRRRSSPLCTDSELF